MSEPTPSRWRLAAFTAFTTVLGLLALEVAFRLWPPDVSALVGTNGRDDNPRCFAPSVTRGWEHRPGVCGVGPGGHLDPEPAAERRPGELRILLLGDSVSAIREWVAVMGAALGRGLGREVGIWNAAVPGYGTCQELTAFRESRVDVDLVLLQTCVNDLAGSPVLTPAGPGRLRFHQGDRAFDFPEAVLVSRALTWMVLRYGLSEYSRPLRPQEHMASTAGCFQGVADLAARRDLPIVALLFPALTDADQPDWARSQQIEALVEARVTEAGLPAVALRPALAKRGPLTALRPFAGDALHPATTAGRPVGEAAAEALLASGHLATLP